VLGGALAPLRGIGPDDLHVADLIARVERPAAGDALDEVLLATNPNVEGESTALYLARRIKPLGVRVTRLALGLPVGAALEFADEITLSRSLSGRREI
jgi:recombination protein RecR